MNDYERNEKMRQEMNERSINVKRIMNSLINVLYYDKKYKIHVLSHLLNYCPDQLEKDLESLELYVIDMMRKEAEEEDNW